MSVGIAGPANAAEPTNDAAFAIAKNVYAAQDPAAAIANLDPASKKLFLAGSQLAGETVKTTTTRLDPLATKRFLESKGVSATVAATYDACFRRDAQGAGKNALGGVLYRYYTSLYYCASGGAIATGRWYSTPTGQATYPGWYYDGRVVDGINWTAASIGAFQQFHFHNGPIREIPVQNVYPCLKTKVSSSGTATVSGGCTT